MSIKRSRIRKLGRKLKKTKSNTTKRAVLTGKPDFMLIYIVIGLIIFGVMAVFSAGAPEGADVYNKTTYFLIKHLTAIALGTAALVFSLLFDYRNWKKLAMPITFVVIALIGVTLTKIGSTAYGSSRWIAGLPIQPSELSKFSTIILVSSALVSCNQSMNKELLKSLGLVILIIFLLLLQPNLSIAIILSLITSSLMLLGGVSIRLMMLLGMSSVAVLLTTIQNYQKERITGWLDPWADPQVTGYNLIQSWYAIGSGGIFGVGYGNSRQKLFWLPFSHTDFIFAVIAEELGLIGCLVLIGLFLAFMFRGFYISHKCPDQFGKLVAFGITFTIASQALINIGVATGVLPVTGVTLPLISHGGTSVVITLFMIGVLLNISRRRVNPPTNIRSKKCVNIQNLK